MDGKGNRVLIIILSAVLFFLVWSWADTEYNGSMESETASKKSVTVYENAWIVRLSAGKLLLYEDDKFMEFTVKSDAEIRDKLSDVTVTDGQVTYVGIKNNVVEGRVLSVTENSLEVEGHGVIPVADNAVVIKNYGELESVDVKDVVVGYTSQKLIVENGEICGIIMDEPVTADTIRVLIMTDNYSSNYHEKVKVSADGGFVLEGAGISESYAEGEVLLINEDTFEIGERLIIKAIEGKITLHSIQRQGVMPKYRGSIELIRTADGIIIINELPLEEYLYAVVPSEMPISYGLEALKVQAVCARSYAYKQMLENKLASLGAHVNDSSQYQVYNNIGENEIAIRAVDETRGQILTHEGEVVEAYYFSTSCGHTTDAVIWGGDNPGYIKGKLINGGDAGLILDTEEKFAEFIKNKSFESYDMEYEWYRWEVIFSYDTINKLLKKVGLYDNVGNVEKLETVGRETGGIVSRLKITGNKGSVIIENEYTIRQFLCPYGLDIVRNDGSTVDNFSLLPSAYFVLEEISEGDTEGYHIFGGGFGHGVGMSQKGARAMTAAGLMYDEVLEYFYNDISIANCYYEE